MRNITLIAGAILLVSNLLFGSILNIYSVFNMWLNSGVIVATTVLLYILKSIQLKDGYYISLSMLFSILGLIAFVLGFFAPQRYIDNWYLVIIILIVAIEGIILTITHIISKTSNIKEPSDNNKPNLLNF